MNHAIVNVLVEGETEEAFVRETLRSYLGRYQLSTAIHVFETTRTRHRIYQGGIQSYSQVKDDLVRWMRGDTRENVYFTTMIDLYDLPDDFPGMETVDEHSTYRDVVEHLEEAFDEDVDSDRFIPYLQCHEFEALLFTEPRMLSLQYLDHDDALDELEQVASTFHDPESIDRDHPPSKRIADFIPEYADEKAVVAPQVADAIGLEALRKRCEHFDTWLQTLESLGTREHVEHAGAD